MCRHAGEVEMIAPDKVDFMDVAEAVSVGYRGADPVLENDDANRALMGSNMQCQAVPLLRRGALRGHRMKAVRAIPALRSVRRTASSTRSTPPVSWFVQPKRTTPRSRASHLPAAEVQRSNQNTCINQRPLVKVGDSVKKSDIIADGPSASSRSAVTCWSRSCRGTATSWTEILSPSASSRTTSSPRSISKSLR